MKALRILVPAAILSLTWLAPHSRTMTSRLQEVRTGHKGAEASGIAGDAKAVKRTIAVGMIDTMRFVPDKIEIKQGETIRFVHKEQRQADA